MSVSALDERDSPSTAAAIGTHARSHGKGEVELQGQELAVNGCLRVQNCQTRALFFSLRPR